jgi:hypothetical protein
VGALSLGYLLTLNDDSTPSKASINARGHLGPAIRLASFTHTRACKRVACRQVTLGQPPLKLSHYRTVRRSMLPIPCRKLIDRAAATGKTDLDTPPEGGW